MSARVSPHDLEAEKAILGAVLIDGERLHDIAEAIVPGDFFRDAHRLIYEAMCGLLERRQSIDLLTVRHALAPAELEAVGGVVYLAGLADGVPRGTHVAEYCRIVRDKAQRRRLQAAADQAIREASDGEVKASEAIEHAEVAIYEIAAGDEKGGLRSAQAVVDETAPILEQIADSGRPVTGVRTGFVDLDTSTRGLQPGNLILVAARPAMGKTAFALNVAQFASSGDVPVIVFSLEMSRTELMIRLLTASGRLDAHRVMSGACDPGDLARLGTAMSEIGAASLWIDDTSTLTVSGIRGRSRRFKRKHGLGLVVIDYLQLLSSERRYDSRVVEVGAMSRALKQLAKELNVPIVCLAQLNRASEARSDGRPKLSDLRESGSLEQDADLVLLLYRAGEHTKDGDPTEAELIIAKSRNGPTGSVKLRWSREMTRFDSWSYREIRDSSPAAG